MQIVPAILTTDAEDFKSQILSLLPYYSTFQIDIQDGNYVPSTTLAPLEIADALGQIKRERNDAFANTKFDFHLMLSDYSEALSVIESLSKEISARYIFVHRNFDSFAGEAAVCATLNPEDSANQLEDDSLFRTLKPLSAPAIQIMTINPGPQGQQMDFTNLEKIKRLRELGYKGEILIDGSVNNVSLEKIIKMDEIYWPDTYCVGSYLSIASGEDLQQRIVLLGKLIEK